MRNTDIHAQPDRRKIVGMHQSLEQGNGPMLASIKVLGSPGISGAFDLYRGVLKQGRHRVLIGIFQRGQINNGFVERTDLPIGIQCAIESCGFGITTTHQCRYFPRASPGQNGRALERRFLSATVQAVQLIRHHRLKLLLDVDIQRREHLEPFRGEVLGSVFLLQLTTNKIHEGWIAGDRLMRIGYHI